MTAAVALFIISFLSFFVSLLAAGGAAVLFIPLSALVIPLRFTAPVVSMASSISGLQRTWIYRAHIHWPIALYSIPGAILGAAGGSYLYSLFPVELLQLIVGCYLILIPLGKLFPLPSLNLPLKTYHFFIANLFVSFISAMVGAAGPIMNTMYLKFNLPKERIIGTKAITLLFLQGTKLASYTAFLDSLEFLQWGLIATVGAMSGTYVASIYLKGLTQKGFENWLDLMLFVSGVITLLIR